MKVAVVLFNLGGPDGPADVQPFLRNLFSDGAIIRAPQPFRWLIARMISKSRAPMAIENYAKMGGGSPLLGETKKQAEALEAALKAKGHDAKCIIAMRYWKPFIDEAVAQVEAFQPDRIVLAPLYPQYSTTTTASSLKQWPKALASKAISLCCYPTEPDFIAAHAKSLRDTWDAAGKPPNVRCLFSAHGLPEVVVKGGDPYQWQVEQTVAAVTPLLPPTWEIETCYQSRVGPLKWIGPSTDDAVKRAAEQKRAILVSPIAFVSEHIETLVELDEEYLHLAKANGATIYLRAPALGIAPQFIGSLVKLVEDALADPEKLRSHCGGRICPADRTQCPNHRAPVVATKKAAAHV